MADAVKRSILIDVKPVNENNAKVIINHLKNIAKATDDAKKTVNDLTKAFEKNNMVMSEKSRQALANIFAENKQLQSRLAILKELDAAISKLQKKGPRMNKDESALLEELRGKREDILSKPGVSSAYNRAKTKEALAPALNILQKQALSVAKSFVSLAKGVSEKLVPSFNRLVQEAAKIVASMLDLKTGIANMNAATSLYTNRDSRENQIKYGLSISQNYGMMKAKELLNIRDDEDLMYMNSNQRNEFLKIMQEQTAFYEKVNSSGVLQDIQRLQMDFEELKLEFANEIVTFIANNKELIIGALRAIFTITKAIMGIFNLIGSIFRTSPSAYTSDVVNTNNSKTTIVNVKATNTNNANMTGSNANFATMSDAYWKDLGRQIGESIE